MALPKGFEQKNVIMFDQCALRDLVREVWDVELDLGERLDFPHNGSIFEFDIDTDSYEDEYMLDQGKEPWYRNDMDGWYDLKRVEDRIGNTGWFAPGPNDILTALCELGKLPAGHYVLDYCW